MSTLKLEYEILVSGVYPFEGVLNKGGFTFTQKTIDEQIMNSLAKGSVIYLSPYLGICSYNNGAGKPVYITLQKEEFIEIEYGNNNEYDAGFTAEYLESLNLFDAINTLEKTIVLEVNNDIKFPIKMIKAYDTNGNFVTLIANFMKLNVPSLLSTDYTTTLEVMKRQNNRLNFGVNYDNVSNLASKNNYFKNALSMYHTSFSVSDHNAGFTLLIIALEALLGLSTYAKPETCTSCGQKKHEITATISKNVSLILMDRDDTILNRIKKLYGVRSNFVHNGKEIAEQDEQELQEYVRKVLLMYWCISLYKSTDKHKDIINELQSTEYKDNLMYQNFLTGLGNTSFEVTRANMLHNLFLRIFKEKDS